MFARRHGNTWYAARSEGKNQIHMHREIINAPADLQVDHINGNGLDNRRENLRLCTNAENARNRRLSKNNTTGYKGVDLDANRYRAQIRVGQKFVYLGRFDDPIEAAKAYDAAAREHYGEFARTNF